MTAESLTDPAPHAFGPGSRARDRAAVAIAPRASQRPIAAAGGLHLALIMDGNGRWATRRGLPRTAGHRRGADAVRRVVEVAPELGVSILTLYAFSSDNWRRPRREVATLMRLFAQHLRRETPKLVDNGVRLSVIGRRDRLSPDLVSRIATAEAATRGGANLHLRIAIDYSGRQAIVDAARSCPPDELTPANLSRRLAGGDDPAAAVDLLVRTGGEQRLSDFLLWECAYAELWFTPVEWPDLGRPHLEEALAEYRRRERRFGAVPAAPTATAPPPPAATSHRSASDVVGPAPLLAATRSAR